MRLPAFLVLSLALPAFADITLVATATIGPDTRDLSGLTGTLEGGFPADRLGGFGSAIAWTGRGNEYIVVPDRGPSNGAVPYLCRFHRVTISVPPNVALHGVAGFAVTRTVMLTNEGGEAFNGASTAFKSDGPSDGSNDLRLDPEGVRVGPDGTIYISDEYGPHVLAFSPEGKLIKRFEVPAAFQVVVRAAKEEDEQPPKNAKGRLANRGFESLAMLPDGKTLVTMVQSPLLQDHTLDAGGKHVGENLRTLWFSTQTGKPLKQAVYTVRDAKLATSEMLAINDHEFLVIERDGGAGDKAKDKKIMRADFGAATDVTAIESLPEKGLPAGTAAAKTSVFIDLLDPKFALAGAKFPAKIEGLAFGPDLPDGRRTLVVTSDNDFKNDEASFVWVFAVDARDLK